MTQVLTARPQSCHEAPAADVLVMSQGNAGKAPCPGPLFVPGMGLKEDTPSSALGQGRP